jgi:hypothetical protein
MRAVTLRPSKAVGVTTRKCVLRTLGKPRCLSVGCEKLAVTGAKVWVAPHFSLASIQRRRLFASCAAARHPFRAEPCRA